MSRSQPKPKIVYKNLQDVIQRSTFKKDSTLKDQTHRSKQKSILCEITNKKSKQNSEEKKKIHFISKNTHVKTQMDYQPICDLYSQWFNQVDAIFTDLEDYMVSAKEKVLEEIRTTFKGDSNFIQIRQKITNKIGEVNKMSEYIKHIANYFIENEIPTINAIPEKKTKCEEYREEYANSSKSKMYTAGPVLENQYEFDQNLNQSSKMLELSMKNSKARANRRSQLMVNRKKTVYELILEERDHTRGRMHTQQSLRR